jgi:hypothetical protein
MRPLVLLAVVWSMGIAQASELPGASFDIRVKIGDQRLVHLALTVPDGTTHRLQVDGDLGLEVRVWWPDVRMVSASLINTAGGNVRRLASINKATKPDGEAMPLSFSVCGENFISLVDSTPGVCAALPPIAKVDRFYPTNCLWCSGPYEDIPRTITSQERIAPIMEPGESLIVTGQVIDSDGRPRADIIVYAYQTDRNGIYPPPNRVRSDHSNYHGRLRGWARSDAQGRYTFGTIRPGSYPNSDNPQHIHMHVIEPGCSTYTIDELLFADDRMLQKLSKADRERQSPGMGGSGVTTPRRKGKGWEVIRDIHLGEKVQGYEPCQVTK